MCCINNLSLICALNILVYTRLISCCVEISVICCAAVWSFRAVNSIRKMAVWRGCMDCWPHRLVIVQTLCLWNRNSNKKKKEKSIKTFLMIQHFNVTQPPSEFSWLLFVYSKTDLKDEKKFNWNPDCLVGVSGFQDLSVCIQQPSVLNWYLSFYNNRSRVF